MKLIFVEKKYTGQELSISFIKANLAKQRKNSRKNENIRKFPYKLKAFFFIDGGIPYQGSILMIIHDVTCIRGIYNFHQCLYTYRRNYIL